MSSSRSGRSSKGHHSSRGENYDGSSEAGPSSAATESILQEEEPLQIAVQPLPEIQKGHSFRRPIVTSSALPYSADISARLELFQKGIEVKAVDGILEIASPSWHEKLGWTIYFVFLDRFKVSLPLGLYYAKIHLTYPDPSQPGGEAQHTVRSNDFEVTDKKVSKPREPENHDEYAILKYLTGK